MKTVTLFFIALVIDHVFGPNSFLGLLSFGVVLVIYFKWFKSPEKVEPTLKTYSFYENAKSPLSDRAKEYLRKKTEQMAIKKAKESPQYKDCSESDMKYMGIKS